MNKNYMLIGLLGLVAFFAYTKLKKTQTVTVDSFDTPMPNVIDISTVAGYRR